MEHDQGEIKMVVYNRTILLFTTDDEAVRRIHRVCCPARRLGALLAAIRAAEDVRTTVHDVTVGLPEVLTAEDVRARLDPLAAREAIVLAAEDVGPRLDGAL